MAAPRGVQRLAIRLAYDGTRYVGWQRQPNGSSVQQTVEEVFSKLRGNRPVSLIAAGRTDAGVHAVSQVAHADYDEDVDLADLHRRAARMLPDDVAIGAIAAVPSDFHARYRATYRRYRYRIMRRSDPFRARYAWHVDSDLDLELLQLAADRLAGLHDCTGISKHNPDTTNMRCSIQVAEWHRSPEELAFEIQADRFLYGMVRLTVGLIVDVARRRRPLSDVALVLDSADRALQSPLAPARGLTLVDVGYPEAVFK